MRSSEAYAGDPTIINAKIELEDPNTIELMDGCALKLRPSSMSGNVPPNLDKENLHNHTPLSISTAESSLSSYSMSFEGENKTKGNKSSQALGNFTPKDDGIANQKSPIELSATAGAC